MLKYRTMAKGMNEAQWKAAIMVRPKTLLASNGKLSKAHIWNFSIPAAESMQVIEGKIVKIKTCPGAGSCLNWCYAQIGSYSFKASMVAHARNLQYVLDDSFEFSMNMIKEIKGKKNLRAIRIHDSGDFYSRHYFLVWRQIMKACPEVQFYAYSKMVPMLNKLKAEGLVPDNFTVVYSQGGKFDHLINADADRHSHVFSTMKEALAAGYLINNYNDVLAINPANKKIGLVFHAPIVYQKMAGNAVKAMNATEAAKKVS